MSNINHHHHKWVTLSETKLICHDCNIVTEIHTLLDNTATAAARDAKIDVLATQLFASELKKDAGEKYYHWIVQNNPEAIKRHDRQGALL